VLRRRAPWTRVVVRSCRVQGEGAALEVADAIRVMAASGQVDVLIVGRGGGSIEDLWAFNEEVVARAIAGCALPVISAVGHEVDVTIADLVADQRAATPSAAAALAVQDGAVVREALRVLPVRFARALRGAVDRRGRRIADAGTRLERGVLGRIIPLRRQALAAAAGKLDALSPLAVLGRGYAVAQDDAGRVLRRVADFAPGAPFALRVSDGSVPCAAKGKRKPR
jgi:exodeoxyribonuclease VII large subunit